MSNNTGIIYEISQWRHTIYYHESEKAETRQINFTFSFFYPSTIRDHRTCNRGPCKREFKTANLVQKHYRNE